MSRCLPIQFRHLILAAYRQHIHDVALPGSLSQSNAILTFAIP